MITRFAPALLAAAVSAAPLCHAASSEEDLAASFGEEEFLSIATGQKQLIAKAPAVASVITADDIKALGATTLEEILETVPGIHVSLSSTYLSPIVSVRGVYTDKNPQVLMLVNGVPITQLHFGDRGGRSFPVRDIARVEVIRGPGSAVYGADALAGVINVITKSAEQIGGSEAGLRGGSFDTAEGWFMHGTRWGEVDVAFSAQASRTDGDSSRRVGSDAQTVFDTILAPFGIAPASLAPGPLATRNPEATDVRLDLKYNNLQFRAWNWRQEDLGVGPGLALALDPEGSAEGDNWLFDIGWSTQDLAPDTTLELRASWMDINIKTRQMLFPAGTVLPIGADGNIRISAPFTLVRFTEGYRGNPEFYEQHARAEAVLTWNGLEKHSLRFATGVTSQEESGRESKNFGPGVLDLGSRLCGPGICTVDGKLTDVSGTPNAFIEDQDRDVLYASLQDQWQIANDWNLTAGLRYDDYSDFGSTVNPRVALVWDMHTDLTAKLLYGRAFRAPSFAELFIINNPVALGNPDLDPETTNTYELAFDWRPGFAWRLGLNLFQYEIEDLIDFESTGSAQRAANVGRQEGKGLEFEAEWQALDSLRVVANFATQSAEDKRLDENTARAPEHMAYLRAHWAFAPDWSATGELRWIADRNREPMDPRSPVGDYTLVNLNLEREHIAGRLDLGLRVRNLLDENAREPSPTEAVPSGSLMPDDFPLEERSVHLTARVRF